MTNPMTDRTPVCAERYQRPDWSGNRVGPEMIRVTFSDGRRIEASPDCTDAAFRDAVAGLTVTDLAP